MLTKAYDLLIIFKLSVSNSIFMQNYIKVEYFFSINIMLGLSGIELGSLKIFSSKHADEKNVIERIYFTKGD